MLAISSWPDTDLGSVVYSRRASRRGNSSPVTPCSSWPINQSANRLPVLYIGARWFPGGWADEGTPHPSHRAPPAQSINQSVNRLPVLIMGSEVNSRRASRRGNSSHVIPCSSCPIYQSVNWLPVLNMGSEVNSRRTSRRGNASHPTHSAPPAQSINQSISQPSTSTKYGQRGELQEGEHAGKLLTRHTVLLLPNQSINQSTIYRY